ncbi:hypothetical protein ACFLSX_04875, partial [Calditrichota bacterium]
FDCLVDTDDPTPLIKVINYIINYLSKLTDRKLEISLNEQVGNYVLSFSVFTEKTDIPPISDQLNEAVKSYNASIDVKQKEGEYIQILITFKGSEDIF